MKCYDFLGQYPIVLWQNLSNISGMITHAIQIPEGNRKHIQIKFRDLLVSFSYYNEVPKRNTYTEKSVLVTR